MKVLGLTGGVGSGKSTCAGLLRARGIPVVDTDDLARGLVEPGEPALAEVAAAFGPELLDAGGRLRRAELARLVFADANARRRLEAILHPRVRELWRRQVELWRGEKHALVTVVIPLLFEVGAERELDAVLCVGCSAGVQRKRLRERGWPEPQIDRRLAAQLSLEEKMLRADYVLWNDAGLELHEAQLERLLGRLSG